MILRLARRRYLAVAIAAISTSSTMTPMAQAFDTGTGAGHELVNSTGVSQIGANAAHTRGTTGAGVTVGIIDTGISVGHSEFSAGSRVLSTSHSIINGIVSNNVTDANGHGSHVAGIIGAASNGYGTIGVAPDSSFLILKVSGSSGSIQQSDVNQALRDSIGVSRVNNLSLGVSNGGIWTDNSAFKESVNAGQLLVIAAGNDGGANPTAPARFAKENWARGQIIAVGAVDSNNVISSFSNRAGDTKQWYVVAPGNNIWSASNSGTNNYIQRSGTSMATGFVTGTAALIMSKWSFLTADQVANVIFKTADDLGDAGVDAVYGWGKVNADRATQPVGSLELLTSTYEKRSVTSSHVQSSTTTRSALNTAGMDGLLDAIATDDFGRGFKVRLVSVNTDTVNPYLSQWLSQDRHTWQFNEKTVGPLQLGYTVGNTNTAAKSTLTESARPQSTLNNDTTTPNYLLGGISLSSKNENTHWSAGTHGLSNRYFGVNNLLPDTSSDAGMMLSPAHFVLLPQHMYAGYGFAINPQNHIKGGVLSANNSNLIASQTGQPRSSTGTNNLAIVEFSHIAKNYGIAASISQLQEGSTLLGTSFGTQALNAAVGSSIANVQGIYRLSANTAVAGQVSIGSTASINNQGNLFSHSSQIVSEGFGLGLIQRNLATTNDRLMLNVTQPLRIRSGSLAFNLPVAQNDLGQIERATRQINLTPTGREIATELSYSRPLNKTTSLIGAASYRHNPGHDAHAPDETALVLRLNTIF